MKNLLLKTAMIIALLGGTSVYSQDAAIAALQHSNRQAFFKAGGWKDVRTAAAQSNLMMLKDDFRKADRMKIIMPPAKEHISKLRADNETIQVLDSVVVRTPDGEYLAKLEYKYDSRGNVIVEASYYWDSDSNAWIGEEKYEYQYDDNNNQLLEVSYDWIWDTNTWERYRKSEHQYDDNNYLIVEAVYHWDSDTDTWVGSWKVEYQYNTDDYPTVLEVLIESYYWDWWGINTWLKDSDQKYVYQYDDKNNIVLAELYDWDSDTNTWEITDRIELKYDDNNNPILSTAYWWDDDINTWVGSWKEESQYDANNNLILAASYDWDSQANDWIGYWKYEVQYDDNNNPILVAEYDWDWDTKTWVKMEAYQYDYQYDDNNNRILATVYVWNRVTNTWIEYATTQYYYSSLTITNLSPVYEKQTDLRIFPNPVSESFRISGLEENTVVTVLNINGKVVLQQPVVPCQAVQVAHLPQGVYMVRVAGTTAKMVKQ